VTTVIATATDTWYIKQGATFRYGFVLYEPLVDLTGQPILDDDGQVQPDLTKPVEDLDTCTARCQIREEKTSSSFKVSATSGDYDVDTNPTGGRIFLKDQDIEGRIQIVLTDADTDKVNVVAAVFDLEIQWPIQPDELRPEVDRILEGPVICDLNVTR
jgi:hypothetical protein